ncbi:MAG: hypothetical protein IPM23_05365 [Candidatus Melainabacteria bacterium]|nr:hypothetical protein [Candidatus Melainabacteria bacterium]
MDPRDPNEPESGGNPKDTSTPAPPPAPATPPASTSSYFEKIVMYIPGTINAGYVASIGILAEQASAPHWLHWAVFLTLWALTPLYVIYLPGQGKDAVESKRYHVLASTLAFAVWVFAIDGGPIALSFPQFYSPIYGSLLLIVTTLVLPLLEKMAGQLSFFRNG